MSVEPASRDAPGWFGKISTLGDFAHRRLPTDFVQACDAWLSRVLVASREQLGERWLAAYLTAPLMRFAWAPGIAGGQWWFGVLMPSCDNVGRYFPLLIAQRRARPPLDRLALDHLEAWFDHLAIAAAGTLAEGQTTARFEAALSAAPPWPTPAGAYSTEIMSASGRHALGSQASIGPWLQGLAAQDLQARFAGCSIWWRRGEGRSGAIEVTPGLPDSLGFVALLTGDA